MSGPNYYSTTSKMKKMTPRIQATLIGALIVSVTWLVLPSAVTTSLPPPLSLPAAFATTNGGVTCEGEIATIVGTNGNDDIVGTSGNDVIAALGGDDSIRALGGDDLVCRGAGNDAMEGGADDDEMEGDDGDDEMDGGTGDDILDSRDGVVDNDSLDGGSDEGVCTSDPDPRVNCEI
jgi:Ca2+-binding RTX toxin-like protein